MTRPIRYLWRMLAFLAAVGAGALLLGEPLRRAFDANPVLNGIILAVLAAGIVWSIRQVLLLRDEVAWLESFRNARQGAPAEAAPRLLAALASMLAVRRSDRLNLSAAALRSVLDGIEARLDETRELSRYMTGLLVFLGLLGTFWGLLLTIGAVAEAIGGMSVASGEVAELFDQLTAGLSAPLRGMGVAFSSSLLGLGGALVLGFLDLTAGQAQGRFATELEDWLAGQTRLSSLAAGAEGEDGAIPPHIQALLEQTADNLDAIQRMMAAGEAQQAAAGAALGALGARIEALTAQLAAAEARAARAAEQPTALVALDQRSLEALAAVERHLVRLGQEVTQGRLQSTSELRSEIKLLGRQLAARLAPSPAPADAAAGAAPRPAPPRPGDG